jgi:hypothetical protein
MTTDDHGRRATSSASEDKMIKAQRLLEASHTLVSQLQASEFD